MSSNMELELELGSPAPPKTISMTSLSLFFQTAFEEQWVLSCKNRKIEKQALL